MFCRCLKSEGSADGNSVGVSDIHEAHSDGKPMPSGGGMVHNSLDVCESTQRCPPLSCHDTNLSTSSSRDQLEDKRNHEAAESCIDLNQITSTDTSEDVQTNWNFGSNRGRGRIMRNTERYWMQGWLGEKRERSRKDNSSVSPRKTKNWIYSNTEIP